MPRHRHFEAYAIVVVEGSFEQTNYAGRMIARSGDLLVQPTLDCHANVMISPGARVLRLAWPFEQGVGGIHSLRDLDALVRLAERDHAAAAQAALREVSAVGLRRGCIRDWPDLLAADLAGSQSTGIIEWSDARGLARETVSRGFSKAFDVSPAAFRTELRARQAWLRSVTTRERLADIALDTGFADQAHMTRSVRAMTGAPPRAWRLAIHAEIVSQGGSDIAREPA
jgi:AraC-like DNA-binding protein